MAQHTFGASALIDAPAAQVYGIIADYRNGHPYILPKPYFVGMQVEQGGLGAGTVINFQMKLMGRVERFHSEITEPEPGRLLVETDHGRGSMTTFRVESREDGKKSYVIITTQTNVPDGFAGKIQVWLTARLLQPIYVKELRRLSEFAGG